jgi:hypothetical protein
LATVFQAQPHFSPIGTVFVSQSFSGDSDKPEAIMTLSIPVPESRKFHARACECRTMAQSLRVQSSRDQMLKAASDFERMAQDARAREIAEGMTHLRALANIRPVTAA